MIYRSILCLNGELPEKGFFDSFSLPLIAADGAANQLQALGLQPDVVIGDLDSLRPPLKAEIVCVEDQDRCDFEKSLEYLEKNALLPTIVVGLGGGELDHILNNISVWMSCPPGNLLYAVPFYGMTLAPSRVQFILPVHTKISLFGLPHARVITKGLEWDLTGQELRFSGFNSFANRVRESPVRFHIREGQALFLARAPITLSHIARKSWLASLKKAAIV